MKTNLKVARKKRRLKNKQNSVLRKLALLKIVEVAYGFFRIQFVANYQKQ